MTNRLRIRAMVACTVIGGVLGSVAYGSFPRRFTSSIEFWFYGGRRSFGPANRLVLRAVEEALGGPRPFPYPSYDFQKIPISIEANGKEGGREAAAARMAAAIAVADRLRSQDSECSAIWLEQAAAPTLTTAKPGFYRWTGVLRLHTPAPLRLDRVLLAEQMRDVKARIGNERFLQRLISKMPLYRLELNSDATAMKRFTAVLRRNLRFVTGAQEDVLRISFTSDDAQQARLLLNAMVSLLEERSRATRDDDFGKYGSRQAWPFEVVGSASLPVSGDGLSYAWLAGAGVVAGLLLGFVFGRTAVTEGEKPD